MNVPRTPEMHASSGAGKAKEQKDREHYQAAKANVFRQRIPAARRGRRQILRRILVGRLRRLVLGFRRSVAEMGAAVGAEFRRIRVWQTAIRTIHRYAYSNELKRSKANGDFCRYTTAGRVRPDPFQERLPATGLARRRCVCAPHRAGERPACRSILRLRSV